MNLRNKEASTDSLVDEVTVNRERRECMLKGVEAFAAKLRGIPSVVEVGIAGSLASDDEYPNDIDAVIFLDRVDDLESIAKCARQMASACNSWEVFVLIAVVCSSFLWLNKNTA